MTTVIVTRQEPERKPVRIPHAPSYPYVRAYRYCMRDTRNMRDAQTIRKVEMLQRENGWGCVVAIVIYPTRATGVFPGPPYPVPHVRRVLSLLRFCVLSVSVLTVSVLSVSVLAVYPEPNRTDPEGMSYIMRRAPVSFQHT